ncbi:stage V sporulation protein AE [Tepidibacillus fermentans]|uniref:Stage V sporulation protein AE n=1 Tax=Tepidibacillus fermentans TaxID=1281767 RepID=A0A4R3KKS3_9BACI|nr:stage V sporulation protein AE [Tepidibacillus fermentans]TCS84090.1 stage V sporulation protein AE [Tepidibacillus fermentans]
MNKKRKVIFITDGDVVAKEVIEEVAKMIGGRCISRSSGNPTPYNGLQLVEMIKNTPYDPVLVMFDDNGRGNKGEGEKAMEFIAKHPDMEVLGAVAVASNTKYVEGTTIDFSVDRNGRVVESGVNKDGDTVGGPLRIYGDTVDILDKLDIPVVVGIGDIGKMGGRDQVKYGSPITLKAIQTILDWGEQHEKGNKIKKQWNK